MQSFLNVCNDKYLALVVGGFVSLTTNSFAIEMCPHGNLSLLEPQDCCRKLQNGTARFNLVTLTCRSLQKTNHKLLCFLTKDVSGIVMSMDNYTYRLCYQKTTHKIL